MEPAPITAPPRGGGRPLLLHRRGAQTQPFGTVRQLPLGLGHDTRTDRHAQEQLAIVDAPAERIQSFGGVAVADPRHVAELTSVPRPPDGVDRVPVTLSRLLDAHERILIDARDAAARISAEGDAGGNDLPVSQIARTGEAQVWFLAEHLVDTPLVRG